MTAAGAGVVWALASSIGPGEGSLALRAPGDLTELAAKGAVPIDSDHDGLPDRQELVLGTDPFHSDTDGDGFGDGEEFAMHTNPDEPTDLPAGSSLSVGMSARGEGGKVIVFMAVHLPQGQMKNKDLRFGILDRGKVAMFTYQQVLAVAKVDVTQVTNGGIIIGHDIEVPPGILGPDRPLTYFAVLTQVGRTRYVSASKADLAMDEGVPVLREEVGPSGILGMTTGHTTIHQPIPPDGDGGIPGEWVPDSVCLQSSSVVGSSGAMTTHQVDTAGCDESAGAYCAGSCPGTAGSSYQTIDVGVLMGG